MTIEKAVETDDGRKVAVQTLEETLEDMRARHVECAAELRKFRRKEAYYRHAVESCRAALEALGVPVERTALEALGVPVDAEPALLPMEGEHAGE